MIYLRVDYQKKKKMLPFENCVYRIIPMASAVECFYLRCVLYNFVRLVSVHYIQSLLGCLVIYF